ncbi:mRNA-capping enzyme-like protein isoform X2 [Tanacetum coccineum]|uniref:rRNA N-glycosylase n=1 Tax=Tanacetum coccineum TaxID=301880 RepID=A0ABQ4Y384_9ASTR
MELTDIHDADRVMIMNYIFDETNWADFMSDFVEEIKNNREVGIIKLRVRHHLADRIFSWVFRKLDVCLVGVEDGDGEVLYELGDRINRWLKDAQLTGYTGSYRDLLGEDEIVGITLSKQVFEDAALAVIRNKGEPLKWKRSFGITSLMISEPARFVPFKDVLAEKFIDGTEMLLAAEGKGKYDWAAYMPNHWSDFSECARRFGCPEPILNDPQSMSGAIECLHNPTAAYRALSLKCYVR